MTERRAADDTLREAFQALGEASGGQCSEKDIERIWQAVAGELPAAERRELVDRMATDPACAEAWRIADALWHASQGEDTVAAERHARSWTPAWLAAVAAVLLLGVTIGLVPWLNRSPGDEFRDPGGYKIESLVPSETLSRETFRLLWTPGPEGSRYQVRVTTDDLRVLAAAEDLTMAEYLVEADRLASLSPGARVLWQVDVVLPGGERASSQTFVTRVN